MASESPPLGEENVIKIPSEYAMAISGAVADPYDESQAELQFLLSKPTCFIILGKPGAGKTSLARKLVQEWKCEMVNATDVISQAMEMQTEIGVKVQEILLRGEAVPESMAAKMIEDKINSPEVAHHGYILDGFPSLSDEYMPIRDQLELIKNWKLKPDFIINLRFPDRDLEIRRIGQRIDSQTGEIYTKAVYDPIKPPPAAEDSGEEEEEDEEEEEEEDAPDDEDKIEELPAEVIERLIRRPEDLATHVTEHIKCYKGNMLRILEDYIADHNQQHLIELDANKSVNMMFKELLTRLSCFVLRPAAVPTRLLDPEEDDIPEEIDTEDLMRALAPKMMVAPRFRWRRSRWTRHCPVALAEGSLILGKPEFAVSFLDKMYVLSSPDAMSKFMKNPRPYLLPPLPRPPCKLVVTGPPLSGKSTLAQLLAQKYGGQVLKMEELIKPRLEEERQKMIDQACDEAVEQAIISLKTKLEEQKLAKLELDMADADEIIKDKAIEDEDPNSASEDPQAVTEEPRAATEEPQTATEEPPEPPVTTEQPQAAIDESDAPTEELNAVTEPTEDTQIEKPKEQTEDETAKEEGETEKVALDDETVPPPGQEPVQELAQDPVEEPAQEPAQEPAEEQVTREHPQVQLALSAALEVAKQRPVVLTPEIYIEVLEAGIKTAEKEMRERNPDGPLNGGWVIDDFPRKRDEWNAMVERGVLPDDIICIKDDSDNGDFLVKRWYHLNRTEVDATIESRLQREAETKKRKEHEARQKATAEKQAAKDAADKTAEDERLRRLEEGDDDQNLEKRKNGVTQTLIPQIQLILVDDQGEEHLSKKDKADPRRMSTEVPEMTRRSTDSNLTAEATEEAQDGDEKSPIKTVRAITPDNEKMPRAGPEVEAQREMQKSFLNEWSAAQALLSASTTIEPLHIDVQKTGEGENVAHTEAEMVSEATFHLKQFTVLVGWSADVLDVEEEEQDDEMEAAEDTPDEASTTGEEAVAEEEDPNRSIKKHLGDTSFFCPVALKEKGVLWPGNPEIAAKYRERSYYLSTVEARERFLAAPLEYLPKGAAFKPPPLRLLLLGPKGAGKTMHGKRLAKKYGLFHIQFRNRLQELLVAKVKKKLGKEYEEEQQEDIPDDIPDVDTPDGAEGEDGKEETVAITAPDGTSVSSKVKVTEEKGGDEENKEEEDLGLTEDEEAIKAYLENDDPLPGELVEKIVSPWWNEQPFKDTGFVLEGFPHTADEAVLMGELGMYPDACVIFAVEDSDVIGRLLPPKLDRWKTRRAKLLALKAKIKDRKNKKKEVAMAKKREELVKERDEKKAKLKAEREAEREAEHDSDEDEGQEEEEEEVEEEEEEDDIEAQLAELFEDEEEEEEEELETLEDAIDRMRNDLEEFFDNDTNQLAAVQDRLEELLIPRIELDGGRKPHIVCYQMRKRLRPYLECRDSMFERVTPISEKVAMKMLQIGYKQPSRFGRWCPVQLRDGECIQPLPGPGHPTFPAIYRQYIYFMSDASARDQFCADPHTFISLPTPKPVVPIRLAIIGPPKSGKSTLARRFAEEYGMLRLSLGDAIRLVLDTQPNTDLSQSILAHLKKGLTVTDEHAVSALEVALMDVRSQTRGFVLDGFPVTNNQVRLMASRDMIPVRVIELQVEPKEIGVRGHRDRTSLNRIFPMHDSKQILMIKVAAWFRQVGWVREHYQREHSNWEPVNAKQSKWWVWNHISDLAKQSVVQIQNYLQRIAEGKASSIADMCITPDEFKARLGDIGQYCPVSLASAGELVDCSVTPSLKFAAEYRGHYYKLFGQAELEQFLDDPEAYVPPLAPRKLPPPELLPKRLTGSEAKALFPMPVELQSYCPVTYLDGKFRYEAIVPGNPELVVQYREQLYYMDNEERLDKFMRLPEKYWNLKLPHKLPPKKNPLDIYGLPMLGYMEQTVADSVIKALTAVGNIKPKYPFLTSTRSALVYVAFHLKAYNPRSSDYVRKKYRRKLNQYEDTCELIRYLGNHMTKRYKDPADRPIDFDFKMEKFMALKSEEPTTSYVV